MIGRSCCVRNFWPANSRWRCFSRVSRRLPEQPCPPSGAGAARSHRGWPWRSASRAYLPDGPGRHLRPSGIQRGSQTGRPIRRAVLPRPGMRHPRGAAGGPDPIRRVAGLSVRTSLGISSAFTPPFTRFCGRGFRWRLLDPVPREPAGWMPQARRYLAPAEEALAADAGVRRT